MLIASRMPVKFRKIEGVKKNRFINAVTSQPQLRDTTLTAHG